MAAWSGVCTVIAASTRPDVLADAVAGTPGVGTVVLPRAGRLSARQLWIGFAVKASGVPAYDAAVERAIHAAEPLPVPSEPETLALSFPPAAVVPPV